MKRDPDNILLQTPCLIHLPIQFTARWEEAAIGGAEHLQHVEQADDAHQLALLPLLFVQWRMHVGRQRGAETIEMLICVKI